MMKLGRGDENGWGMCLECRKGDPYAALKWNHSDQGGWKNSEKLEEAQ